MTRTRRPARHSAMRLAGERSAHGQADAAVGRAPVVFESDSLYRQHQAGAVLGRRRILDQAALDLDGRGAVDQAGVELRPQRWSKSMRGGTARQHSAG